MIQSGAEVDLAMWWDIEPGLVGIEYLEYLPAKGLSFKTINKLLCHYPAGGVCESPVGRCGCSTDVNLLRKEK